MVHSGRGPTEKDRPEKDRPISSQREDEASEALYFFPDQSVSEVRVRWILQNGSRDERAWVISHLLRFALWDDIWTYVSREEAREVFPHIEMSENLRAAWARLLKVEVTVGS